MGGAGAVKLAGGGTAAAAAPGPLSGTLPLGWPALFYGVRMWAAVCLALYIAFRLELQSPSWAGTTAAIVCQPVVGASLRKGWFRMIGTVIGAVAIVLLSALFPQSRVGFLVGLALWGGACAMTASLLRNFASYAAALAGYTAAIVAGDTLGDVGGASATVFDYAVLRATEIGIGIASGTAVLALTDLGGARRALGEMLAGMAFQTLAGLCGALGPAAPPDAGRAPRRALLLRAAGLSVALDQAAGEISSLPFRPRVLQLSVQGIFRTLSAWRLAATHRFTHPEVSTAGLLDCLPARLRWLASHGRWEDNALALRHDCLLATRALLRRPTGDVSGRLLTDALAGGLLGIRQALLGVALLTRPGGIAVRARPARAGPPDLLPPLLNGVRAFLTIGAAELFWVVTAWPGGMSMVVFAAVVVTLFAPQAEGAFGQTWRFLLGSVATAVLAAVIAFAVLPQQTGFGGFCFGIGLVLVPAGALAGQAWQQPVFVALASNFIPLLAPANPMTYDPGRFYNSALPIVLGVALAALSFKLMPPLPPAWRARRLLALALRDLQLLAGDSRFVSISAWEGRQNTRLSAMPEAAAPVQPARLVAAMAVGSSAIRLRAAAARLHASPALESALHALRTGRSREAIANLAAFDATVEALHGASGANERLRQRARANSLVIAESLAVHGDYFDAHGG